MRDWPKIMIGRLWYASLPNEGVLIILEINIWNTEIQYQSLALVARYKSNQAAKQVWNAGGKIVLRQSSEWERPVF